MRFPVAVLICTILTSCGQHTGHTTIGEKKPVNDSSFIRKNTFIADSDRWHFKKYLGDPAIPQSAKNIFNDHWKLKEDDPSAFLEKLHGQDIDARPFYFRVITNSYKQSDGAYSEALGNAGYEYIKAHPGEFSNYFIGQDAFTDKDLQVWADIVMLEFSIIAEDDYGKPWAKNYLDEINSRCLNCSDQQKKVLKEFGLYLNNRWAVFLKNIEN